MADLTLERIAELRAMHEKVRSSGWADAIKAMAEWSLQLRMSSDVLLDAAERGMMLDVLANLTRTKGVVEVSARYDGAHYSVTVMRKCGDYDAAGDELHEAISPLAKLIKEPTDAS